MGILAVILGLAWFVQVPILGKADMVGLYLSRVAEANTWLLIPWFVVWCVAGIWIVREVQKEQFPRRLGAFLVLGGLFLRFVSLSFSKAMAVWWGDLWIPFIVVALLAAILLFAGICIALLLFFHMIGANLEEEYEELYMPVEPTVKEKVSESLFNLAILVLLYV